MTILQSICLSCKIVFVNKYAGDIFMALLKIDMHTHTIASGHAYSTLKEMALSAADKGLELLGVTEHGPGIPGTCDIMYFRNIRTIPRNKWGVELMIGAEANITDYNGTLDLDEEILSRLDLRIAGIHKYCYIYGTPEENTAAVVNAIKNPWVDIISHPDEGICGFDYDELAKAAEENEVLLELNNNSLHPAMKRKNVFENNIALLKACRKRNLPIIIDSDAHTEFMIGECDRAYEVVKAADFPEELIINNYPNVFKKLIEKRHSKTK